MGLGMGRTVRLEALPVVGQVPSEEDLSAQVSRAGVGPRGPRPLELPAALGIETGFEGPPKMRQQVAGQGLELLPVGAAVGLRRRAIVPLPELDEQVKRGHFHRLFDALGQLRIDALHEAAGIVRAVAKPCGLERMIRHDDSSMRLSPCASGSGVIPKSV